MSRVKQRHVKAKRFLGQFTHKSYFNIFYVVTRATNVKTTSAPSAVFVHFIKYIVTMYVIRLPCALDNNIIREVFTSMTIDLLLFSF